MALSDEQHKKLKSLLRLAIEGGGWHERRHALEDAAKIIGVTFNKGYHYPDGMKVNAQKVA